MKEERGRERENERARGGVGGWLLLHDKTQSGATEVKINAEANNSIISVWVFSMRNVTAPHPLSGYCDTRVLQVLPPPPQACRDKEARVFEGHN